MNCYFGLPSRKLDPSGSASITKIYKDAVKEGLEKGFTPVIVYISDDLISYFEDVFGEEGGIENYVSTKLNGKLKDPEEIIKERLNEHLEYIDDSSFFDICDETADEWIDHSDSWKFDSFLPSPDSFTGDPYLIEVPTRNPYEVFAWIPFCGFNECPDVDEMISLTKRWYEKYGAVPAQISFDTLSLYLSKPVSDRQESAEISKELFAVCPDIAFDCGGIEPFFASVYNSYCWQFWWD
ncbi:MAG: DUF4253 domain-containing protein [Clostridia bacterium]|nr:DUF4253 domain-containing protein [Clostridia bacterium]